MEASRNVLYHILTVFCFILTASCQASKEDFCTTPGNHPGQCISINSCHYLNATLGASPRPLTPEQLELLQKFHCGFHGSTPKVCCPITIPPDGIPILNSPQINNLLNPPNCGGKQSTIAQFPWMALLAYTRNESTGISFRCGGTLINENYILTAAQCITQLKSHQLYAVRLGEYDTSTDPDCYAQRGCAAPVQDLKISEVIPHSGFDLKTMKHDIGLLRLATPADVQNESVRPVCLPLSSNSNEPLTGKLGIITGWGATETGYLSTRLLKLSLPIISNEECQQRYKNKNVLFNLHNSQFCAGGERGKDACSGDGGGPLGVYSNDGVYTQHGIVSFGSRFCGLESHDLPGVYTNVGKYIDWIKSNVKA